MKPYDRTKWLDETSTARKASLPRRVLFYGATGVRDDDLLHLVLGDLPRAKLAELAAADPRELVTLGELTEKQAGKLIAALELTRRLTFVRARRGRAEFQ